MKVEWLRSLAGRLRSLLAEQGVTIAHGQALDMIASVPGLRDWPEVVAFPERVAACRFDGEAAERLARRIASRHSLPMTSDTLLFRLKQMSLFYQSSSASSATKRLIVTSGDSGSGHLKRSGIADHVIRSHAFDSLVSGPVPEARGPAAFFAAREAAYDADPSIDAQLYDWNRTVPALQEWSEVLALCEAYERVELWIDPDPDSQLRFVQLLSWLGDRPDVVEKLHVVHADQRLGELGAEAIATMNPCIQRIGGDSLCVATRAWQAWCRSTPVAWFDLLAGDLDVLPHLRRAVLLLLGELPAAGTSLGATERLLLEIVAPGGVKPMRFFHANTRDNPSRVFGFFDEIRIVNRLGGGPRPAIDGLHDATFGLDTTMDDTERRQRYMQSELSLSSLGRGLVAGSDDFARHNVIHRWWGGTLLTNTALWRWDRDRQALVAPV